MELSFAPRLPGPIRRLAFRLTYRGALLYVEVLPEQVRYVLRQGDRAELSHYGEAVHLTADAPEQTRPIPAAPDPGPPPTQPPGREPRRRRPSAGAAPVRDGGR